jgi:hypothetical protein
MACRRCSDCEGHTHHWLEDLMAEDDPEFQPGDYGCKHCPQRGDECGTCGGEGCIDCDFEGVIPVSSFTQEQRNGAT